MLIRTQPPNLLQIFYEFMLNSKVIFKNIIEPDELLAHKNYVRSLHEVDDYYLFDDSFVTKALSCIF